MHSINEDIQKLLMLNSKPRPPIDAAVQEFPNLVFHPPYLLFAFYAATATGLLRNMFC